MFFYTPDPDLLKRRGRGFFFCVTLWYIGRNSIGWSLFLGGDVFFSVVFNGKSSKQLTGGDEIHTQTSTLFKTFKPSQEDIFILTLQNNNLYSNFDANT